MDNAILVTLSAQNALMRQLEVSANNMANVSTNGYKSEELLFQPIMKKPASIAENPRPVQFVRDYTIARDFRPGALQRTENPLDVALTGDGFFSIKGDNNNTLYTRDGQFTLDPNGKLVTHDGKPVLDDKGKEITINLQKGPVLIGKDGNITQNSGQVAKLGIVSLQKPGTMKKIGDNLWQANGETPKAATNFEVAQGMVEGSNVNAVVELTNIMQISRAFESATKLQKEAEDLKSKAIQSLAKI